MERINMAQFSTKRHLVAGSFKFHLKAIVFKRIKPLEPKANPGKHFLPIGSYQPKRDWKPLKFIEASEITTCQWCKHGVEVDTVVDDISTNAVVEDISASDAVVDDNSASGEQDCSADGNLASVTKEGYDKLVLDVTSLSIGDASAVPPPKKQIQELRRKSERRKRLPAKLRD